MCNELSEAIQDWMDPTVNPCDDFYQFTCGKFMNDTIVTGRQTPEFDSDPYQGKNITSLQN